MIMASVNKVTLIGNLGRDPILRSSPSGSTFAQISVATTDIWKDDATGKHKEYTEWHRVVFSGKHAERVGSFLKKGSKIYIEGRLRTRRWTDAAGVERFVTEIIGETLHTLDRNVALKQSESSKSNARVITRTDSSEVDHEWVADYDRYLAEEAAAAANRPRPPQRSNANRSKNAGGGRNV
jgi:single-strand DNA-binding protein